MTTEHSPTIAALAGALAAAQGEMHNPIKDAVNPHFKSRYADLATVRDAVIPALSKHKLAIVQLPMETTSLSGEFVPALLSILMHESGEFIKTTMYLRATKNDPQGIGSALTYARRYALQSIAGVAADDDDDGNHASRAVERNGNEHAEQPKPRPSGGQHAPPREVDAELVHTLEKTMNEAKNRDELRTVGTLIAGNKAKLTPAGAEYLRNVYRELDCNLPNAADPMENMDAEPVGSESGREVAF